MVFMGNIATNLYFYVHFTAIAFIKFNKNDRVKRGDTKDGQ